jgi:hypothetical protein
MHRVTYTIWVGNEMAAEVEKMEKRGFSAA